MVTIRQLYIDWAGRVEVLVYDQNRFIRSWIRKRFEEVKNPYRRRRVTAAVGHRHAAGMNSQHALSNRWATNPSISSDDKVASYKRICQIRARLVSTM
jgi:hypothetical protein